MAQAEECDLLEFQFTCPSRSTTASPSLTNSSDPVSIHVPLAEHDLWNCHITHSWLYVSIHVPLAEHDALMRLGQRKVSVSIHVPLAEHDVF